MAGPGSIAFVRFAADSATPGGDQLSFVLLDPSLRGQTITITDNAWLENNTFRSGEGGATITIPVDAALGTVFNVQAAVGAFDGAGAGDQFIAYIGTAANPTFLAAVQFAHSTLGWITAPGTTIGTNTSYVPTGLTIGTTALQFINADNGVYAGSLIGTAAEIAANIANAANWTLNDSTTFNAPANFTLSGSTAGSDTFTGTAVADFFDGSDGADTIDGDAGDDGLAGGAGNDVLIGGSGTNTLIGNLGNDIFVVSSATDIVTEAADEGIDSVETNLAAYTLTANVENLEYTGAAAFTGTGNALANIIVGGTSGDTLDGGDGDDTLGGEAGDDTLTGGLGNDRLNGGTGADTMNGGDGNDTLVVDDASDIANGGAGTDTVQFVTADLTYAIAADVENVSNISGGGATVTLNGLANTYGGSNGVDNVVAGAGADIIYGRGGNDGIFAGEDNDRVFGDTGVDTLSGEDGNDLLYGGGDGDFLNGGAGNDTLYGEAGDDSLTGGTGLDILNGGLGADTYFFGQGDTGATIATADRIQGFNSSQGDLIDLSGSGATSFIGTAVFSNSAGELRTQLIGGNTYVQCDTDGNGVADFMIRVDGNVVLSNTDFNFGPA